MRAAGASPDIDVVVVTRGGGSASLDAYDERAVIVAVADCPRPVMVAVGHHSDRPLAEMVAWRRATPARSVGKGQADRANQTGQADRAEEPIAASESSELFVVGLES